MNQSSVIMMTHIILIYLFVKDSLPRGPRQLEFKINLCF